MGTQPVSLLTIFTQSINVLVRLIFLKSKPEVSKLFPPTPKILQIIIFPNFKLGLRFL